MIFRGINYQDLLEEKSDLMQLLDGLQQIKVEIKILLKQVWQRREKTIEYLNGGNLADAAFSLAMVGKEEWIRLHNIFKKKILKYRGKFL